MVSPPWLHSERQNAKVLTGSRPAGEKCNQSRRPKGKRCWLTRRTFPQAHATPFEQLGPTDRPPLCQRVLENQCAKIQVAADCGHAKWMYEGIKTATGPTSVKTAPLKSKTGEVTTDQSMQLQHWVEHYFELY